MSSFTFKETTSSSKNVTVEKLPPITKPPKKYEIVELENGSSDIIEELGYKAYEKTISIGFKEDEIGEVSAWLNGSGQLVLSNEPDKYYDAIILNQIDYERALRFKKAEVTFLVQPYKYDLTENETASLSVTNKGNVDSLPMITIYGSGTVGVYINGVLVCNVTITDYITIDSEMQEAKKGTVLQNRNMVGMFPTLKPGANILSFSGTVTSVSTRVRSRWI